MQRELVRAFAMATTLVMSAAVADYRPRNAAAAKLKRRGGELESLALAQNPDIVRGLARGKGRRTVIGFAAETGNGEREARRKLADKGLDLIVLNDVTAPGAEFGGDTNLVRLLDRHGGDVQLPLLTKDEVAGRILDWLVAQRRPRRSRR
jgi:phosphopantothenoylcysteine decarboxylase/phosphopantothenate--cysteine ligase